MDSDFLSMDHWFDLYMCINAALIGDNNARTTTIIRCLQYILLSVPGFCGVSRRCLELTLSTGCWPWCPSNVSNNISGVFSPYHNQPRWKMLYQDHIWRFNFTRSWTETRRSVLRVNKHYREHCQQDQSCWQCSRGTTPPPPQIAHSSIYPIHKLSGPYNTFTSRATQMVGVISPVRCFSLLIMAIRSKKQGHYRRKLNQIQIHFTYGSGEQSAQYNQRGYYDKLNHNNLFGAIIR